jgi:hypothetical protein
MKKLVIRLIIGLVLLVILGVVAVIFLLDGAVKAGVEKVGPRLTGVDMKLESASVSLLSGKGSIKGLVVGNPAGFKTPWAMRAAGASLALEPRSLLSDKIVIRSIKLEAPEVTFEFAADPRANNLSKILSNVQGATSGTSPAGPGKETEPPAQPAPSSQPAATKPAKKLQVDEFLITGAKVRLNSSILGGELASAAVGDIHLNDLGKGPDGITSAELAALVLGALETAGIKAAAGTMTDINKGALYIPKNLGAPGSNTLNKAAKGLGDLLKGK